MRALATPVVVLASSACVLRVLLRRARGHGRPSQHTRRLSRSSQGFSNADQPFRHHQPPSSQLNAAASPTAEAALAPTIATVSLPHAAQACSFSAHSHHVHSNSHAPWQTPTDQHPHYSVIATVLDACRPGSQTVTTDRMAATTRGYHQVPTVPPGSHSVAPHISVTLPSLGRTLPRPVNQSPCVWVRNRRQLRRLGRHLLQVPEFAIDTEHNADYSYWGVTCLLQISDGDTDWLVDTLRVWQWVGAELGPAFSSPRILKVLHGCSSDVVWLQRDFGLYLVNVFDTERAAMALGYTSRSLAALLRTLCGVSTDKSFQLADWTTRPLTPDMELYARTDVHYLGYIAGRLCSQLTADSAQQPDGNSNGGACTPLSPALCEVLQQSQQLTLQLYHNRNHADEVTATATQLTRKLLASLNPYHTPVAAATAAPTAAATAADTVGKEAAERSGGAGGMGSTAGTGASVSGPVACVVAAQLEALCCWRDVAARAADCSVQLVMSDSVLMALVVAQPRSQQQALDVLRLHSHHPHHADPTGNPRSLGRQVAKRLPGMNAQAQTVHAILSAAAACAAPGVDISSPLGAARPPTATSLQTGGNGSSTAVTGATQAVPGVRANSVLQAWATDKQRRERVIQKFSSKGEVYQNCRMMSREGQLLCHCDKRKLEWYIAKGLAERVSHDPPTIRLLFEHKNTDQLAGEDFYSQSKKNRCVVCGEESHYLRYRVVPSCYRRQFPVAMKSHRSHDVVLLCIPCHQLAHTAAQATKEDVVKEYGIPLTMPKGATADGATTTTDTDIHSAAQGRGTAPSGGSGGDDSDEGEGNDSEEDSLTGVGELGGGVSGRQGDGHSVSCPAGGMSSGAQVGSEQGGSELSEQRRIGAVAGQARRAAAALQKAGSRLPEDRRRELESTVKRALGRDPDNEPAGLQLGDLEAGLLLGVSDRRRHQVLSSLPEEVAQAAKATLDAAVGCRMEGASGGGHTWHGQQVVAAALARGGEEELHKLVARFRASFVAVCKPRFLPASWDVQHRARRAYGEHSVFADQRLPPNPVVDIHSATDAAATPGNNTEEGLDVAISNTVAQGGRSESERVGSAAAPTQATDTMRETQSVASGRTDKALVYA